MDKVWNYEYMFASEAESFEERTFLADFDYVRNFFRNGELRHVWYNPPISKSIRFFMPIVWTSNSCAHIGIKHYVWNFRIGPQFARNANFTSTFTSRFRSCIFKVPVIPKFSLY